MEDVSLTAKKNAVLARIREHSSLVVALSGGVDSAVLLALSVEALGVDRVLAVTGRSASVPDHEIDDARAVAAVLGVRHEIVETRELEREGYRANAGDRCYHCRQELFEVLGGLARERGIAAIAYGAIRDDVGDFRPGMRAAAENGVLAPLLEAGLFKAEVRLLAEEARLPVREKPASPCLASRIPVGTEVAPKLLEQVRLAETALRALGFRELRVRHHGEVARIELDPEGDRLLGSPGVKDQVVSAVRSAGFRFVALDLEGFRSGSLNPPIDSLHRILPARDRGQ